MKARPLAAGDMAEVERLLSRSALLNLPLANRLDGWARVDGEFLVYPSRGALTAVCGSPPAMTMTEATRAAGRAFGLGFAGVSTVRSITGPGEAVAAAWDVLGVRYGDGVGSWRDEVVMATSSPAPAVLPRLAGLRRVDVEEVGILMPAASSVFEDTNGASPEQWGVAWSFRRSMEGLARRGLSFASFDPIGPEFKAEVNIVRAGLCQVKGVWVRPDRRGEGLGVSGMAALLDTVLDSLADTATLRVDAGNRRARSVYERTGFRDVGRARSVLAPPD